MSTSHTIEITAGRNGAIARRLVAALAERAELLDDGAGGEKVVISAGDRAFALHSVSRLLDAIADEHGAADWTQHLQLH